MEKYFLFTTGDGPSDPLNWSRDEAGLYAVSKFLGMRPGSATTIVMYFEEGETVTLKIKNGYHVACMETIGTAVVKDSSSVIVVADVDRNRFINQNIYGVTLS